jgi:ribosomal protein S12 methylthiotransferase accessory factor YcaO
LFMCGSDKRKMAREPEQRSHVSRKMFRKDVCSPVVDVVDTIQTNSDTDKIAIVKERY